jgi:hypothetical protein
MTFGWLSAQIAGNAGTQIITTARFKIVATDLPCGLAHKSPFD